MSFVRTLTSVAAAPAAALLEARLGEFVDEALREADLAEARDLQTVAARVTHAVTGLSGLADGIDACRTALDTLVAEAPDGPAPLGDEAVLRMSGAQGQTAALSQQIDTYQRRIRELGDAVVELRERTETVLDRARAATSAATASAAAAHTVSEAVDKLTAPRTPAKTTGKKVGKRCKVDGCDGAHRARGYCGRHYQMWRRGTLDPR